MGFDATVENFADLIKVGNVLIDFWGPKCAPCLALMPKIEELERRLEGELILVKVNAPENQQICRTLKIWGLPTYVLYRDGLEVERLSRNPTLEEVKGAVERMLGR